MAQPIPDLLKQFSEQPTGRRYVHDTDKIDLLVQYLWLRQLTPSLPFETFLQCFAAVADHDEENLKHPDAAIRAYCPRSQAMATKLNREQWTAKQVAAVLCLYVDVIRHAESQNQPVTMDLKTFLAQIGPRFLAGEFDAPKPTTAPQPAANTPLATPAPAAAKRRRKAADTPATPGPTPLLDDPATEEAPRLNISVNQTAIYRTPGGQEICGTVRKIDQDQSTGRYYVDFQTVEGEMYHGVAGNQVRPAAPADAPLPTPPTGHTVAEARLYIPSVDYANAEKYLALGQPVGTAAIGAVLLSFAAPFTGTPLTATIAVINGETGVYVDAYLHTIDGTVVADVPPRRNLLGDYTFQSPQGLYAVRVSSRASVAPPTGGVVVPPAPVPQQPVPQQPPMPPLMPPVIPTQL
jgi:hypothetical protein